MIRPRPPPTFSRLPKILTAAVVGFVAFPGTLTVTAAAVVGSQSTIRIAPPTTHAVALTVAVTAVVAGAAYYTTRHS